MFLRDEKNILRKLGGFRNRKLKMKSLSNES